MIENILSRLEKVRPNGKNKFMACCPAHSDKSPSLSIRDAGDRVLLHCFAGCEAGDILAAIGLSWRDIMPPINEQARAAYGRMKDAAKLKRVIEFEKIILSLNASSDEDLKRKFLARQRIEKIQAVLHV